MTETRTPNARLPYGVLIVLAVSVYANVASQFVPAGLFPEMSESFGVSESALGVLIAVFAASNMIAGPPLAHLTRHSPRKPLLLITIAGLSASTMLTALAPNFAVLTISRILGGAAVALSQAVIIGYVARLVRKSALNRGNAIVSGGGVAAALTAVPIGIALGDTIGWQLTFGGLAVLILLMAGVIAIVVPAVPVVDDATVGLEHVALRHDRTVTPVLLFCLVIALVGAGAFSLYTYIDPYLSQVAGLDAAMISTLLLVYAAGGVTGLLVAGWIGDLAPRLIFVLSIIGCMIGVAVIAVWPTTIAVTVVAFAVWGFAISVNSVTVQSLIMHTASPHARDVAASWLGSAQNLGIGGGALLGAALLSTVGVAVLPLAAEVVWVVALVALPFCLRAASRVASPAKAAA